MKNIPKDGISSEIAELQKPLAGRRVLSWLFFLVLIFATLVMPAAASLWPSLFHHAALNNYFGKPVHSETSLLTPQKLAGMDVIWNPGQLSNAHQPWVSDCKACHSAPFVQAQDADCLACHKDVGDHVSKQSGDPGSLHGVRCASCHREHKGQFGLLEQNQRFIGRECSACHSHIQEILHETKTQNVSDFALDHPNFRIQLNSGTTSFSLTRERQVAENMFDAEAIAKLTEKTGLKFPHDVHLAANGVDSPNGKKVLKCVSCHVSDASASGFLAVTMKDHCQQCHALKFELAVPEREVPHGSVDQVLSTLKEFYSYVSVYGVPVDGKPASGMIAFTRPTKLPPVQTFVKDGTDVRSRAIAASTELFEKTSCVVCHNVKRVTNPNQSARSDSTIKDMPFWEIARVSPQHAWMPKVGFSHRKHDSVSCSLCHAADHSKLASDVLMPTIAECRECHTGQRPVADKVVSDCGLCHGFHSASGKSTHLSITGSRSAATGKDKTNAGSN